MGLYGYEKIIEMLQSREEIYEKLLPNQTLTAYIAEIVGCSHEHVRKTASGVKISLHVPKEKRPYRVCCACKRTYLREEFGKSRRCKPCSRIQKRLWYADPKNKKLVSDWGVRYRAENAVKRKAQGKIYRATPEAKELQRKRAKKVK